MSDLAAEYGTFINVCVLVVEDTNAVNAELKAEFKSSKLPQMRFYPVNKMDQEKKKESFEIILPKGASTEKAKEVIVNEV